MLGLMHEAVGMVEGCKEFAGIVPEVRTNIVYAKRDAKSPGDVLAVDGRITVANGAPWACRDEAGKVMLRFGGSSHMARLLLNLRLREPKLRAGINFASSRKFAEWLKGYCEKKGWVFSRIDRANEPIGIRGEEGGSMPWKAQEAIRAAGGRVPKVFYDSGAVGKEPVSVLVGANPVEVAGEACAIARAYFREHPEEKVVR